MSKKVLLLLIALFLVGEVPALPEVYGLFHPASSLRRGRGGGGGYLILWGDDPLSFGVLGKGRIGLGGGGEVGAKLGLLGDGDIGFLIGADYKQQFLRQKRELPLNLAGDWGFLMRVWGDHLFWALNSTCIVDHSIRLEGRRRLTPYGGLTLSINYTGNRQDHLDLDLCLNLGVIFGITQILSFVPEIEIGDNIGLGMGLSYTP